jgi:xanthine/uracil permease
MFNRENFKKIAVVFGLVFGFLVPVVGGAVEKTERSRISCQRYWRL